MKEELKDSFFIKCKKCDSENIEIVPVGYGGEILIYCKDCDNAKEI